MEQLNVFREHNKDLLKQLRQEKEAFERLSGCDERTAERAEIQAVTGQERSSAGAAAANPSGTFADTFSEPTASPPPMATQQRQGPSRCSVLSDFTTERSSLLGNRPQGHEQTGAMSFAENQDEDTGGVHPGVSDCGELPAPTRHHVPPLLGYDWIAGLLDIEDSVIERSDEFFSDLRSFRSLNKNECVSSHTEFPENPSGPPVLEDEDDPKVNVEAHQCTFSYQMNSRLFPVPLHSECCTVCKKHKSSHPHTLANPALIRVSVPCSAVLPPYKHRAHRRSSFNPSDSLGLPSHCLAGWSNRGQNVLPVPGSLDLRSSATVREGFSVPRASTRMMSDVSRLAPQDFQHFSPKQKETRQHF